MANDNALFKPFYNYEYPGSPGSGVLTYLPTEDLPPGNHQLYLVYPKQEEEERTKEFYIPFWFGALR